MSIENGQQITRPIDPHLRLRTTLPFDSSPDAQCPRWLRFLEEVFDGEEDKQERIMFLQEFLGACLMGITTTYERVLLLTGEGANGKSVWLETVEKLFPPALRSAIRPQDFAEDYKCIDLIGKLINIAGEIPEGEILASDRFKAITDGALVSARNPYERVANFHPRAGHIYSANRLPATVDFTKAFFRRFIVITFNRTFENAADDPLLRRYLAENELPGIALWGLAGAVRLCHQRSYTYVHSSDVAKAQWRREVDPVALFVEECLTKNDRPEFELGTELDDLYNVFRAWLTATGHKTMSRESLSRRLRSLDLFPWKDGGKTKYPVVVARTPRGYVDFDA